MQITLSGNYSVTDSEGYELESYESALIVVNVDWFTYTDGVQLEGLGYPAFEPTKHVSAAIRHYIALAADDKVTQDDLFDYLADAIADHYDILASIQEEIANARS